MANVILPDASQERLFKLVQSYASCKSDISTVIDGSKDVELTAEGGVLRGQIAALRWVATQSPRADQLLGQTNEERCKIAEILSLTRGLTRELLDNQVDALNAWLERRTFAATSQLTIADLVLFASLSKIVADFPVAQHGHFCNLLRWYENVFYLVDGGKLGFPDVANVVQRRPLVLVLEEENKVEKKKVEKKKADTREVEAGVEERKVEKKKGDGKRRTDDSKKARGEVDAANTAKQAKPPKKKDSVTKEEPTVDWLDIRVGLVKSVGPHPDADSLFIESIDLGEDEPRTVVSGLRKFVSEEAMTNRLVAVVCNLKPAKMRGVLSTGMVLCASNKDHTAVDPILIPEGSTIGSRVMVTGYEREPETQVNPKKKVFERIAPDMRVGEDGICRYKSVAFETNAGIVTASIPNASIA